MSILLELFDRTVKWELLVDTRATFRAQFIIDELTYEVNIDSREIWGWTADIELYEPHEVFRDAWEIHFAVSDHKNHFSDEKITGTGNAIVVFTTVIEIVSHAIKSKNIQTLSFAATSDEPSRVKLYDRMVKKMISNGWRYIDDQEIKARSDAGRGSIGEMPHMFILTKQPRPVTESTNILLELFDRSVDWELLLNRSTLFKAQFVINELKYEVVMDGKWTPDIELINPPELFNDIWEINFTVSGTANMDYYSQDKITGTGNAILVFSTVVDIVSHAVESQNIQTLNFSADNSEPTRVKLYHRMATYFAKKGWRYIGSEEITARRDPDYNSNGLMTASDYLLTKHPKPAMTA